VLFAFLRKKNDFFFENSFFSLANKNSASNLESDCLAGLCPLVWEEIENEHEVRNLVTLFFTNSQNYKPLRSKNKLRLYHQSRLKA
jgi:hypothetical protein